MRLTSLTSVAAAVILSACGGPAAAPDGAVRRITSDLDLRAETRALAARVRAGMTLGSLLQAGQVPAPEAAELIAAVRTVFDPRRVNVDQPYRLVQTLSGALRSFEYEIDRDRFLRVIRPRGDAPLVADILPIPKRHENAVVEGAIDRERPSLFAALQHADGTVELAVALAGLFSGDIDFNTELQRGDRFAVLVDRQVREPGEFSGYGPIFAAEFENGGRRLQAFRFTPEGGEPAYYDEQGRSTRRFMLRSPLKFDPVVTSGFSRRRMHPVLGVVRPHLGVDYRAPTGAPVIAVAHGVVTRAGVNGGAGRMVTLRHANGYETEYLHLSAIAVKAGARVTQGDLIGRVGSTGLATGPHLDYRIRKNGVFINPLTALRDLPPSDPVPADQMAAFIAARDRALVELQPVDDAQ